MHKEALEAMAELLKRAPIQHNRVLDVGSLDLNGSYRRLIEERGDEYTGLDLVPGKNVDLVSSDPYHYPIPDDYFDVVISGSTMEHVEYPWLWVPELVRVIRPGGLLCIVTHWCYYVHRHPVDCWRTLPDGMRAVFKWTKELVPGTYHIKIINEFDIVGSAIKKEK